MTNEQVIDEILQRADEAYNETGKERARKYFRAAVAEMALSDNFKNEDMLKLIEFAEYDVLGSEHGVIEIDDIPVTSGARIMRVKDAFMQPESEDVILSRIGMDEVRRMSYSKERRPSDGNIFFWQTGKDIRFIEAGSLVTGMKICFVCILAPPGYSETGSGWIWTKAGDMLTWFSFNFLLACIDRAAAAFLRETMAEQ